MQSFFIFLFTLKVALCSCGPEVKRSNLKRQRSAYKVSNLGQLTPLVNECSGLVYRGIDPKSKKRLFWAHNDSGGRPVLYGVSEDGALVDSLVVNKVPNVDWEDLAQQDSTALFIGDIGNNSGNRQNLTVYKINPQATASAVPEAIRFTYRDQTPTPAGAQHNFDSEALIHYQNQLYVFSKNRSLTNRFVKLYRMPASAGTHGLMPQDSIYLKTMVTGGAVSPDGKMFALVSYGKVFLFGITADSLDFRKPLGCLRIPRGQTEAICFVSPTDLVMANEKGKLFLIKRKR